MPKYTNRFVPILLLAAALPLSCSDPMPPDDRPQMLLLEEDTVDTSINDLQIEIMRPSDPAPEDVVYAAMATPPRVHVIAVQPMALDAARLEPERRCDRSPDLQWACTPCHARSLKRDLMPRWKIQPDDAPDSTSTASQRVASSVYRPLRIGLGVPIQL